MSVSNESESSGQWHERIKRKLRLTRTLGKTSLLEAIDTEPIPERVEYSIVERVELTGESLQELDSGNRTILAGIVRDNLRRLDLSEDALVFRAFAHPRQNITEEVLARYGTDRFHGYGRGRLPQKSDGLVPFKNQGETEALTADTYVVPDLEWALAFTNLTTSRGAQDFREGHSDPYLIAYKSSSVFTERTPGGRSGEQWRGVFLTDPTEALVTVMHFVHEQERETSN